MHLVEYLFSLTLDLYAHGFAQFSHFGYYTVERFLYGRHVNYHHHIEIFLNDSL